ARGPGARGSRAERGRARPRRDPDAARGLPRDAGAAPRGGDERPGDRGAGRAHPGVGPRQPASRNEAAPREAGPGDESMSRDYLWDKSGPKDPEVEKLENQLGVLRYRPRPLPDAPAEPVRPPAEQALPASRPRVIALRTRLVAVPLALAAV